MKPGILSRADGFEVEGAFGEDADEQGWRRLRGQGEIKMVRAATTAVIMRE